MGADRALLEVRGISAHYGRVHALKPTSLTVKEGELVTILGPNGAGKSTLLRALTRLTAADGQVMFKGRDVSALGFYMAFGCFKLAAVLEGIHARFLLNQTVGEGFEKEGAAVPSIIQRAHRLLDEGV